MSGLIPTLRRLPRWPLYVLAGLIQVGLIALMVFDRAGILREGREVVLQTRPVDPRDFLRGDYVVLNYEISSVPAGGLKDQPAPARSPVLYLKLKRGDDGFHHPISLHLEPVPVTEGEVVMRGRTTYGARCNQKFCENVNMTYGIEKYFVPQGEGLEIEHSRNQGKVAIVAAVTPAGRAAIKRLLVDGKPVYDEPLF